MLWILQHAWMNLLEIKKYLNSIFSWDFFESLLFSTNNNFTEKLHMITNIFTMLKIIKVSVNIKFFADLSIYIQTCQIE